MPISRTMSNIIVFAVVLLRSQIQVRQVMIKVSSSEAKGWYGERCIEKWFQWIKGSSVVLSDKVSTNLQMGRLLQQYGCFHIKRKPIRQLEIFIQRKEIYLIFSSASIMLASFATSSQMYAYIQCSIFLLQQINRRRHAVDSDDDDY